LIRSINGTGFVCDRINDDENNIDKYMKLNKWFDYYEPETKVISRSGDVCIVALTDQWFINYGDIELKKQVDDFLKNDFYSTDPAIITQLLASSEWIKEWPCSRNYGLGTTLPGTNQVIDS